MSCVVRLSSDIHYASVLGTAGWEIGVGPLATMHTVHLHPPPDPAQVWVRGPSCKRRPPRLQGQPRGCPHTKSSERATAWRPCPAGSSGPYSHLTLPLCPPGNSQMLEWVKEMQINQNQYQKLVG